MMDGLSAAVVAVVLDERLDDKVRCETAEKARTWRLCARWPECQTGIC